MTEKGAESKTNSAETGEKTSNKESNQSKSTKTKQGKSDKLESKENEKEKVNCVENSTTKDKDIPNKGHENGDSTKENAEEKEDKENGGESPIRLTLEEEETLHDDETENLTQEDKEKDKKDEQVPSVAEKSNSIAKDASSQEVNVKKQQNTPETSNTKQTKMNPKILWISNVTKNTRASDIKQALSPHGKVVGAKVVVNAKFPGSLCFGYVTMNSVEDATNVIAKLNNTELNGQIIKIEKFDNIRTEQMQKQQQKTQASAEKAATVKQPDKEKESKGKEESKIDQEKNVAEEKTGKDDKPSHKAESDKKKSHVSGEGKDKKATSSKEKQHRARSGSREVLTFDKIQDERNRQRWREKERLLREETRRRQAEALRQKEIERKQQSEARRLERERERLRVERERIEKEKAELIRLERERQKAERERLEREKLELERTRLRLEEDRRAAKRPSSSSYRREDGVDDRKRVAPERHYNEPPLPPPRYDAPTSVKSRIREPSPPPIKYTSTPKNYKTASPYEKRDSYSEKRKGDYVMDRAPPQLSRSSGSSSKYESRDVREARPHEPVKLLPKSSKDARYLIQERQRDRSPHFHGAREERRGVPEGKFILSSSSRDRYPPQPSERFSWSSRTASSGKSLSSGFQKHWSKDGWRPDPTSSVDRWNGPPAPGRISSQFSSSSNLNMGPACPPPPGINSYPDRFEYNRLGGPSGLRKY